LLDLVPRVDLPHQAILAHDEFLIRKKGIDNRRRVLVKIEFEVVNMTPFPTPEKAIRTGTLQ
jgi:hypothetical protein